MERRKPICTADPQAIEKLADRLQELQELRNDMKNANALWRKTQRKKAAEAADEQTSELFIQGYRASNQDDTEPYSSLDLDYNYYEIMKARSRMKEIVHLRGMDYFGWEFDGGKAVANYDTNRLQVFFDGELTESQKYRMNHYRFAWNPSALAWERKLNEKSIRITERIEFLKPSDGRTVKEHQPGLNRKNEHVR